jgi:predicted nucleotidyltransferase
MDKTALLLFGKTRQAVLSVLCSDPARRYYLRELARVTGISPGAIQYELGKLQAADLVVTSTDRGRKGYGANSSHPIFEELRSILRKTSGIPGAIREGLEPRAGDIKFACIYGSVAKGTSRGASDIDLLVVGTLSFADLVQLLVPVEARLGREISPRLYAPGEFRERIARNDRFLTAVLRGPVAMVLGTRDDIG